MASVFLTLLAATLVLLIFYTIKKYTYWTRKGIPTAKGFVPLVGHFLPVLTLRKNPSMMYANFYNDHKNQSMVGSFTLMRPVLMVREPELIKTVLQQNFQQFHENIVDIRPDLDPLIARNPFFSSGEKWSRARKRMTYAFSNVKLKVLHAAVIGVCKKFEDYLNRRLAFDKKYEVELKQLFSKFTGEVVANAGLGIEGFCFEEKKHPMAFDTIGNSLFAPGVINTIVSIGFFLPQIRNFLGLRMIPKELDQFFRQIVKENLEIRRKDSTPRSDYLQLMLDLEKTQRETINEESITAETLSFYVDGFETSSITLTFIGYELASHPDVQEKLRQEVISTIANHGDALTFEAVKEMKYMDQVISETQRHITVVGHLAKKCTEAFELIGKDGLSCLVEPGTEIIIPNQGVHHDEQYWPNPEKFDPERFNEENKNNITKMTFLPFGEGPRMCVGMRMALLQIKMCLSTLLSKYKLELSNKTQLPLKMTPHYFLTSPIGGIWVNISKL